MVETIIIPAHDPHAAAITADAINSGGLAVLPTETVYGLAVDLSSDQAVESLYRLKSRDRDKPLTVFIKQPQDVLDCSPLLPGPVEKCSRAFMPGPITLVAESPDGATTGMRIPDHPLALDITRRINGSLGVTSVNTSGEPPLETSKQIIQRCRGSVDVIIDSGTISGTPSSVVSFGHNGIQMLRPGSIMLETIRQQSMYTILFVCSGNICRSAAAEYYCRTMMQQRITGCSLAEAGYHIHSAGTYQLNGNSVPAEITALLEEEAINIRPHRSQGLSREHINQADRIFVMDRSHADYIRNTAPESMEKVTMLDPHGDEIADPYMGTMETYRHCMQHISSSVTEALKTI